ncbi:Mov34/MPN/PAD-1 family protein [Paenibacillus sp. 481]|nr:Mov34/MPN/PAD-1 family protein [Paenibacillus sp. 481]
MPKESCGILLGLNGSTHFDTYVPIANHAADPIHSFRPDPATWTNIVMSAISNQQQMILVHTHPSTPPVPSSADAEGLVLASGLMYGIIIVSFQLSPFSPQLRAYRLYSTGREASFDQPYFQPIQVNYD